MHVGADDAAERQLHNVARHQLGGGHVGPGAVTPRARPQRQPRFQRVDRRLGAAFLDQAERGIEHQQHGDDAGLDVFVQEELHRDRRLEQARHGRDELAQEEAERMLGDIGRRVRPVLRQPAFCLGAGKAGGRGIGRGAGCGGLRGIGCLVHRRSIDCIAAATRCLSGCRSVRPRYRTEARPPAFDPKQYSASVAVLRFSPI